MNVTNTPLEGVRLVELDVFGDRRGFFVERFNTGKFESMGLPCKFYQDNHSRSSPGVIRGLHFQIHPAQGKLVGAVRGKIWDVAVDIRKGSPTYGKHFGSELSDENGRLLWVPPGFAHGFLVLGTEPADVLYKIDAPYAKENEKGILWNDPELKISWPFSDGLTQPTISDRDQGLMSFAQYQEKPDFHFGEKA